MVVSVELPDEALARLQAEAGRRGLSLDELLAELAATLPTTAAAGQRRALSFVGLGSSASGRRAAEADEMLAEGFGRDRSAGMTSSSMPQSDEMQADGVGFD